MFTVFVYAFHRSNPGDGIYLPKFRLCNIDVKVMCVAETFSSLFKQIGLLLESFYGYNVYNSIYIFIQPISLR